MMISQAARAPDPLSSTALLTDAEPERHYVQLYDGDEELLIDNVGKYLAEGLSRGQDALVIAAPEHREAFTGKLQSLGVDVAAAERDRRVAFLDAEETLLKFMAAGSPDAGLFNDTMVGAARRLYCGGARASVRGYGGMVGLLWDAGQVEAAVALEALWNRFLAETGYTLFCAYHIDIFAAEFDMSAIDAVLCAHTHLLPGGREGVLESAMERALHEIFGSKLEGLRVLMKANFRPSWAVVPKPEAIILWLRRNLPDRADDVLARARRHYLAAQSGSACS